MTATMVISSQIVTEWIGNTQDSEQAELHFSTHTVCWTQLLQYVPVCHTQYHCYMVRKAVFMGLEVLQWPRLSNFNGPDNTICTHSFVQLCDVIGIVTIVFYTHVNCASVHNISFIPGPFHHPNFECLCSLQKWRSQA